MAQGGHRGGSPELPAGVVGGRGHRIGAGPPRRGGAQGVTLRGSGDVAFASPPPTARLFRVRGRPADAGPARGRPWWPVGRRARAGGDPCTVRMRTSAWQRGERSPRVPDELLPPGTGSADPRPQLQEPQRHCAAGGARTTGWSGLHFQADEAPSGPGRAERFLFVRSFSFRRRDRHDPGQQGCAGAGRRRGR